MVDTRAVGRGGGANGAAALGADHRGAQFADVLHTQNGGGGAKQGRLPWAQKWLATGLVDTLMNSRIAVAGLNQSFPVCIQNLINYDEMKNREICNHH
jgi:hypothetical protein